MDVSIPHCSQKIHKVFSRVSQIKKLKNMNVWESLSFIEIQMRPHKCFDPKVSWSKKLTIL